MASFASEDAKSSIVRAFHVSEKVQLSLPSALAQIVKGQSADTVLNNCSAGAALIAVDIALQMHPQIFCGGKQT